jgi:hypothetical protein
VGEAERWERRRWKKWEELVGEAEVAEAKEWERRGETLGFSRRESGTRGAAREERAAPTRGGPHLDYAQHAHKAQQAQHPEGGQRRAVVSRTKDDFDELDRHRRGRVDPKPAAQVALCAAPSSVRVARHSIAQEATRRSFNTRHAPWRSGCGR